MPITQVTEAAFKDREGIHVFGASYSNNVGRVLLMLEEKGLDYEQHAVDLINAANLEPGYLHLHPQGTIPALLHAGKAVSNSNDILRYLEETFPSPALSPQGASDQEEMWRSVDQAAECHIDTIKAQFYAFGSGRPCSDETLELYKVHNPALYQFHSRFRDGMSEAQKAQIHSATGELLAGLEARLAGGDFLMGAKYTVADIAWVTNVIFLERMGYGISPYKRVCAWKEAIERRPSVNKRSRIPKIPLWLVRAAIKLGKFGKGGSKKAA